MARAIGGHGVNGDCWYSERERFGVCLFHRITSMRWSPRMGERKHTWGVMVGCLTIAWSRAERHWNETPKRPSIEPVAISTLWMHHA